MFSVLITKRQAICNAQIDHVPTWRPLREDIYRFRYQQAKIANSKDGDGYHSVYRERYLPYPGTFFQDNFLERVRHACTILATIT